MSTFMSFIFDEAQVRIHGDESGEAWFVARDVAEALEYPETSLGQMNNLTQSIPDDWKGHKPIRLFRVFRG